MKRQTLDVRRAMLAYDITDELLGRHSIEPLGQKGPKDA
jgi:hypothetical protein